jgi:lipid-A-disaccharide synthase
VSSRIEIFLSAGEASGDDRGAELVRALLAKDPSLTITGMGGPKMKAAGMNVLVDITGHAVFGLIDSLKNYSFFKKVFDRLVSECIARKPAVILGIDYPGFNLRFERAVRKKLGDGATIIHYVSPQVWAWREARKYKMADFLDLLLCIFPFEPAVYADTGLRAVYVGHPLAGKIRPTAPEQRDSNLIALLPGSRRGEIELHWPVLKATAQLLAAERPELRFVVGSNDGGSFPGFEVWPTDKLLASAQAGIVALGTATVESCLHGMPIIVVYKVSLPTYWVSKPLLRLPNLAMPSVIAGERIVPEFIQGKCRAPELATALEQLLDSGETRSRMAENYARVRERLGDKDAAENAASLILQAIRR